MSPIDTILTILIVFSAIILAVVMFSTDDKRLERFLRWFFVICGVVILVAALIVGLHVTGQKFHI